MSWKIVAIFTCAILLTLMINHSSSEGSTANIEVFDFYGNKKMEREFSLKQLKSLEDGILKGNLDALGIKFDFGFSNYFISYGKGKVFIPISRERCFIRLMLRPIFFNYEKGFTLVKFGANNIWNGKNFGDYGMLARSQCGLILGFFGLHIKISWQLRPDTHIFVGNCLLMAGGDKVL